LANGPWIAMFVLTVAHFIFVSMQGGITYYYFQYYVNKDALYTFMTSHGLVSTATSGGWLHSLADTFGLVLAPDRSNVAAVGYSLFNISGKIVVLVGVVASVWL